MKLVFTKMHGLGNDFIVADVRGLKKEGAAPPAWGETAKRLCARHTGIGADGLVLVQAPSGRLREAALRMEIYNSDGSAAAMCGNAMRCFAAYAWEKGLAPSDAPLLVETRAGLQRAELLADGRVQVLMGAPRFLSEGRCALTLAEGTRMEYVPLVMGVEHAVVFVEDPCAAAHMESGAEMAKHPAFPQGTNVDFIRVKDRENILMRVYERGCGPTLCCGTGAAAAALAAMREGLVEKRVWVHLRLGALEIEEREGLACMRGPAQSVYEGEVEI